MTTTSTLSSPEHAPRPPWRRASATPATTVLTFAIKAIAVVVIAVISYRGLVARFENSDRTRRTLGALRLLEEAISTLKDAETGERGYIITGDERYLDPFESANASMPAVLTSLKESLLQRNDQLDRFALFSKLSDAKLAELEEAIALRRKGDTETFRALVPEGKAKMDAARQVVRDMEDAESAYLTANLEEQNRIADELKLLTAGGALFVLIFIGVSFFTTSRAFRDRETQAWTRVGQNLLTARLQGEQRLDQLADRVIRFLADYVDARVGVIHEVTASGGAVPCGTFAVALTRDANTAPVGLVAQVLRERRVLRVADVPAGYLRVASSTGSSAPRELVLVPAMSDQQTLAVIELGFFRKVGAVELDFLERAAASIAIAFLSLRYRARQEELLEESQRQSEELQAQQEELKSANEELENQARRLRSSQGLLEETNAQLEEQTQALEAQKDAILNAQGLVQQKAAEVERASRYKSEFLANMSHELRTPLNSSLILTKLLIDNKDGNLSDEQVRYAQSIYAAGNDLLTLINDILDLAKIEAGKVDVNVEPVPIARLLENLRRRFDPVAKEKALSLRFVVEPDCPSSIESDPHRLQQILTNLLSNALKFTEAGSVTLRVGAKDARWIDLTVEDTGIGIAEDKHEVIFEAFRQADGTTIRKYGGTGLGLSICKELVELLGGRIQLKSAPGEGSAFSVTLPRRTESVAAHARDVERPPLSSPARAARRERAKGSDDETRPLVADDRDVTDDRRRAILVVEDDAPFAEILRDLARELGFQCIVARDGDEALALARSHKPVAVVLDIGLPDQSGLTVLELLKRDPATRHVPIHIASVHDYEKVARELGAVGYVLKPVKREQLVAAFRVLEERLSRKVKRVLVIEDDDVQREGIVSLLQLDDVEVVPAANARDGVEQLKRTTFDCCVLDLFLPDENGFDLLERLAKDQDTSFPPVIVYTARSLERDEEAKLRRLSSSVIVKGARSPERLLEEVTLFLHQVEAELPPERQRMLKAARERERVFEGRRILLVEDDVRNIFALSRVLEPKGVAVEIARNGNEALARLAATPSVDLVLMDVMMPEMDGISATRELRKDPRFRTLPVIALTAKAMPDDRKACLDAGASDYIAKPVDVEKLLSLLRVWMPR